MVDINKIRGVLTNEHAQRIRARLPGISFEIRPNAFREVANRLALPSHHTPGRTIKVEVEPALAAAGHSRRAAYHFRRDTLGIPGDDFPATPTQEALLIHEAVHAYHDIHGRTMQWDSDEMLAHVAEMAYLIRRDPRLLDPATLRQVESNLSTVTGMCRVGTLFPPGSPLHSTHPCEMAYKGWALLIAVRLRAGQEATQAQVRALRSSLMRDPTYSSYGVTASGRATRREYDRLTGV